jgi:uncharacterized membrane protein
MDEKWIWATIAVGGGLMLGSICGFLVRRLLGRPGRRPALQQVAAPASIFVFWLLTAAGALVAIAVSSPDTLRPIPADILAWLPNAAIAGLLLLAGYALGLMVSTAVGRMMTRASGTRHRGLERAARTGVFAGAVVLALGQLDVDTTTLNILIAAAAFGFAAALAGIAVVGARSVAPDVAAGRNLQRTLRVGSRIEAGAITGTISELGISHLVLDTAAGAMHVPYTLIAGQPLLIIEAAED